MFLSHPTSFSLLPFYSLPHPTGGGVGEWLGELSCPPGLNHNTYKKITDSAKQTYTIKNGYVQFQQFLSIIIQVFITRF